MTGPIMPTSRQLAWRGSSTLPPLATPSMPAISMPESPAVRPSRRHLPATVLRPRWWRIRERSYPLRRCRDPRRPGSRRHSAMRIELHVAALVLLSALIHASWNTIVKSDVDRLVSFAVVMISGTILCLFLAPFVAFPSSEAWGYIVASTIVHNFYYFFLLRAYAHGDLSHVYPIARGMGPLLVAIFSGR